MGLLPCIFTSLWFCPMNFSHHSLPGDTPHPTLTPKLSQYISPIIPPNGFPPPPLSQPNRFLPLIAPSSLASVSIHNFRHFSFLSIHHFSHFHQPDTVFSINHHYNQSVRLLSFYKPLSWSVRFSVSYCLTIRDFLFVGLIDFCLLVCSFVRSLFILFLFVCFLYVCFLFC